MDNRRCPSKAAADNGGGTSSTVANSTNSNPKRRGAAKQAATCREDQALLRSFQSRGQPTGHTTREQGGDLTKLNYMDIKSMIDKQQALNKKGTLTDGEIKSLVREWHKARTEVELNQAMVEMEVRAMEKKLHRYNVA